MKGWIRAARPALLPFVLLLPLAGYGWAHWDGALPLTAPGGLAWVLASWTALHVGTLWMNAERDRDAGPVLFGGGRGPRWGGPACLAVVPLLASPAGVGPAALATAASALAVGYSHPRTAWKAHPVLGPAVNWLGYGLLSPAVGHAVVGPPASGRTIAVALLAATGVSAAYFAAQVFQGADDRARGDRTMVAAHGPGGAALAARVALGVAAAGGLALAAGGWLPRSLLASAPAWWMVDRALRNAGESATEEAARRVLYRMLVAAFVALGLAFGSYVWDSALGGNVAGLATARGSP